MEKIGGGVMYQYLQNVQSYIAPPVTAVFLLGIIWKRVNSDAAITTLFMGLFLLILRLGSEIYFQPQISSGIEVESFLFTFATINFAHMAIILFIFSVILCVSVSLITAEPDYVKTRGLSFGNLDLESDEFKEKTYSTIDVVLSVFLVVIVIGILMYFTE
jgi:SSS family solute:Na+ symporter